MKKYLVKLFAFSLTLLSVSNTHAGTLTVTTTADVAESTSVCSLRMAIEVANGLKTFARCSSGSAGADTITANYFCRTNAVDLDLNGSGYTVTGNNTFERNSTP